LLNPPRPPFDKGGDRIEHSSQTKGSSVVKEGAVGVGVGVRGLLRLLNPPRPPFDKGGGRIEHSSQTKDSPLVKGGLGGICFFVVAAMLSFSTPVLTQPTSPTIPNPLTPQSIAQARARMENRVAVSVPGTRVCRELTVGIGQPDWIRGVVIRAEGDELSIRINDPGRFSQAINGVALVKDVVIRDVSGQWTPCS
jgi:hypothetical protein